MDLFSTNILTGVVNSLIVVPMDLVGRYFRNTQTETTEEIHFDVESDVMGLAPFVSPVVEGKVMTDMGFKTKTFKPAYIKPKNVWDGTTALKRTIGEPLTGSLSPMDRMRAKIAEYLTNHRKMINRRFEVMASEILRTGKVTVEGDLYPKVVVDFGRDSNLTVTLAAEAKWDQTGVHPLNDLQDWRELILKTSGSDAPDVIMTTDVWKVFKNHADVKDRLTLQRRLGEMPSLDQAPVKATGATYMGTIDGFNIFVYSGWYKNDSGTVTAILPAGTVLLEGDLMGYQAFGAIRDEAAGYQALPYFAKSWTEEDPPVRFVMTQSAPLLVPYRPNASLCSTVL